MVALLATGGSTNHLIHWVAVARAAGILIDWTDFAELSAVVPLLARVYPNGSADVNQFQAAGGPGLRAARAARRRLPARRRGHRARRAGWRAYTRAAGRWATLGCAGATCRPHRGDDSDPAPAPRAPFSASGGLKLLQGNLGRAVIKISAVPDDRHVRRGAGRSSSTARTRCWPAFNAGELERDFVAVVRFQGPRPTACPSCTS